MKNPLSFLNHTLTALFLVCTLFALPPVFAENASPGDLHFLENFAIKIYERDDILQAKKEFERILKIDPANATAKKYLDEISTRKNPTQPLSTSPTLTRLNDIISDIKGLKFEILNHEKDAQQLGLTIRSLITENDSLYVALRKRTRDLAELREKFQGTPYNEQYSTLMKDLPPDRVPQRAAQMQDMLPEYQSHLPQTPAPSSQNEIEALTQEMAKTETELKTLRATPHPDEKKISELETALRDKRALLTDKTAALIENKESLLKFQDQLTTINSSLKDADSRYATVLGNLDKLAQDIKTAPPLNDAETQKKYRDLLGDYAAKIKELDQLKITIAQRDSAMVAVETTLTTKHKTLTNLDSSIHSKDLKIEEYRSQLSKLKADLTKKDSLIAEKDAALTKNNSLIAKKDATLAKNGSLITEKDTALGQKDTTIAQQDHAITIKTAAIAKQKAALNFTNNQLNEADQKIESIQGLLKENDNDIAQLQDGISKVMAIIRANTTTPKPVKTSSPKTHPVSAKAPANVITEPPAPPAPTAPETADPSQKKIEELTTALSNRDDALALLQFKLVGSEKELSERGTKALRKDEDLLSSQEKLADLEKTVAVLQEENNLLKKTPPQPSSYETKFKKPQGPPHISRETSLLHDILAKKDKTIIELNKKIIAKNVENHELSAMVDAHQAASREKNALIQEIALLRARLAKTEEEKKALGNSRCALQSSELDIQERDTAIHDLLKTVEQKTAALNAADKEITLLQENLSVFKIKQDAIKNLIEKRDKELAVLKKKFADAEKLHPSPSFNHKNMKKIAPPANADALTKLIKKNDEKMGQLKKNLADVQNKFKKQTIEKKNLERMVTKQTAEIAALQKRLNTKKK